MFSVYRIECLQIFIKMALNEFGCTHKELEGIGETD
jgi:hypothetical protein